MENYEKRLDFLTPEQSNQVLFSLVKEGKIKTFLGMVGKGYGLTPFILNALIDFGYEGMILQALQSSVRLSNECYNFLCEYWGKKKTEVFFVEQKYYNYIKENFHVKTLVEYQLWDILAQKEKFYILAENGQFDILAKYKKYQLLVKYGQLDYACHKGLYQFLAFTKAGMERLIQLKKWKEVFEGTSFTAFNGFSVSDILEILYDNGMQELLFAKCCNDFLLDYKKYTKPYVANKKLSCQLYQRSADIFLGVPFNIASYALLLMMMAQVTGLKAGDFVHTLGDAHIYNNHIEQVKLQLTRDPRPLPRMEINPEVKDLFAFRYEDFTLTGYDPHPHIKGEVSV